MTASTRIIRADFDRIAQLTPAGWNHNEHYHAFLLKHLPARCQEALEVGCGTGAFSRLLSGRACRVLALDLSPQMIEAARERSSGFANIDFQVADAVECEFQAERFDCIATIATLHHLPLDLMLHKMKRALKPGGLLLILDLFEARGLRDSLLAAAAMPLSIGLRIIKRRSLRAPAAVRAAWAEHERHDSLATLSEVRKACALALPEARIRRHLLWRYSVVWKKPLR